MKFIFMIQILVKDNNSECNLLLNNPSLTNKTWNTK